MAGEQQSWNQNNLGSWPGSCFLSLVTWVGHSMPLRVKLLIGSREMITGQLGGLSGLAPPSALGVILETRDRVPHWVPCMEPASLSVCVSASLSLCLS